MFRGLCYFALNACVTKADERDAGLISGISGNESSACFLPRSTVDLNVFESEQQTAEVTQAQRAECSQFQYVPLSFFSSGVITSKEIRSYEYGSNDFLDWWKRTDTIWRTQKRWKKLSTLRSENPQGAPRILALVPSRVFTKKDLQKVFGICRVSD